MIKVKVLVVDDESAIRKLLQRGLTGYGYRVEVATNGEEALTSAAQTPPDIILLDVNLSVAPHGLEVCQKLREWSKTPIIMLTVRDEKPIRLAALNAGADDYITKPFDMEELEARMRAVLRRSAANDMPVPNGEIHLYDLAVDLVNRRVMLHGEEVHLTPKEYDLLRLLITNPGKVLTFGMLLNEVWGPRADTKSEHNVRVHINTLRKKLEDDFSTTRKPRFIFNEPGIGYRFADLEPAAELRKR